MRKTHHNALQSTAQPVRPPATLLGSHLGGRSGGRLGDTVAPIEITILIALVFISIFHIYMGAFASWHVRRSICYEPGQKYAQYVLVWLVPVIGSAIVLHMLSFQVSARRPGWVPWFDFLLVSAFASSATAATEEAIAHNSTNNSDSSTLDNEDHD